MINIKLNYLKTLYNFFLFLSLIIFFFSTDKVEGKTFDINNIEISRPFEINFDKNEVIDEGFKKAFSVLPGMSGLWQVSGRNKLSYKRRIQLDLIYAKNINFILDLNIFF